MMNVTPTDTASSRVNAADGINWGTVRSDLTNNGYSVIPSLIDSDGCAKLIQDYEKPELYRSIIKMERYSFGKGEYRYYSYPLPNSVEILRNDLFSNLAAIANSWNMQLGVDIEFPEKHTEYISTCHSAGQVRPTPLILRYAEGDYNCLHQDLYGDLVFPLQLAVMLSDPDCDFTGGEFVLTEQRPRMQSRAEVVALKRGDAVVFPVNERPVKGSRGYYRVKMRHGVSKVKSGNRHVLGIIFHDAK